MPRAPGGQVDVCREQKLVGNRVTYLGVGGAELQVSDDLGKLDITVNQGVGAERPVTVVVGSARGR